MKLIVKFSIICFSIFYLSDIIHEQKNIRFSYDVLAKDSIQCEYLDLGLAEVKYSQLIDSGELGIVTMQKIAVDKEINYYKYNFANTEKQLRARDAIEIRGTKFNIDSLYYGKQYDYKKPYMFTSLVNISKFNFSHRDYIAFFIQDISNPVTLPNTLILLFDITEKDIINIPVGFQASEDLKCFNDFNKDGILDFANWQQGYDFKKRLYRYELKDNKFTKNKHDYVTINEEVDDYYIDSKNSCWSYGSF